MNKRMAQGAATAGGAGIGEPAGAERGGTERRGAGEWLGRSHGPHAYRPEMPAAAGVASGVETDSHRPLLLVVVLLVAVALGECAWLAYPGARNLIVPLRDNPAQRGWQLASTLGCFTCHGPGGSGGVPNPGSESGEVPSFHERTIMMYARDDGDLRAYILDGGPPARRARNDAAVIRMPAFRDFLAAAQVDELVAYLRVASDLLAPPDGGPAARGAEVAQAQGCFTCHGSMGIGGQPNPGSLKGYIPGFGGADFEELVHDDDELRAWITGGGIPRLRDARLPSYFITRQRIQMPVYEHRLAPADIDALVAYVRWLAAGEWQRAPLAD